MSARLRTIEALGYCYDQLEGLMAGLSPADWASPSLCPEWTVREVVAHLASVEHALSGWVPAPDDDKPPFEKVGSFIEQVAGLADAAFAAEVTATLTRRRQDLAATSDEVFAASSMTPVGPATYHRFMNVRVFDFWVHQRDMAQPLGVATEDGGDAAELTLDEVQLSMGYIVGRKIELPDGMSLTVHLTGPVRRDLHVVVDGRAGVVERLDAPSVELTTDSTTFIQLACGRLDPQAVIDAGAISWSGDATWGEKAARNLAFTM